MDSAVFSKDAREQQVSVEPEDASEDLFWLPVEVGPAGPLADKRFIL
ncbi:hypothetical protein [Dactylosporangium salmoneum]|uniref:Uncharacterized protein n=1 Tax=Dactylosporangium salmoneum TaxID=53361 RepID=A0ABN3GMG2_9ACTN